MGLSAYRNPLGSVLRKAYKLPTKIPPYPHDLAKVITQHNHLLYAVPYQHFTNSIENYFSMLKSRLQKLDGLTHAELKENIINTIIQEHN